MKADKRQTRVKELLGKLKSGQEITLRDFKSVLGKDEYAEYEAMWVNEKDKRGVVKPKKILEYEKRLREVKLSYARHEKHRQNYGSTQKSVVFENETQHLAEKLTEFWNDLVTSNSSLMIWFDRSRIEGLSIEDLPHVIYSKSNCKKSDGFFTKRTKRELKIEILENILNPIEEPQLEEVNLKIGKKKLTKSDFKDFKV
jgi:hypothetical protein